MERYNQLERKESLHLNASGYSAKFPVKKSKNVYLCMQFICLPFNIILNSDNINDNDNDKDNDNDNKVIIGNRNGTEWSTIQG